MLLKDICNFLCHSIVANNHDIVCALDSTPLWHEQHGVVVPSKPGDAIPCDGRRRHPVGDLSLSSIINEHQCSNVMLSNPDSAWSCTQVTVQPICFNRLQKPRRPG